MKTGNGFVAYLPGFKGSDALLILADSETIDWMMAQFGRLSSAPVGSVYPPFPIGDGNPIESDGLCLLVVELENQAEGSRLIQDSDGTFRWSVSRLSAGHYRELLSGISEPHPAHQYLDSGNSPPAPVVIVSRDEYDAETFRRLQN